MSVQLLWELHALFSEGVYALVHTEDQSMPGAGLHNVKAGVYNPVHLHGWVTWQPSC